MPSTCRVCQGRVREFLDMGRQPSANAFLLPSEAEREFFYRLAIGICEACTMVQLIEDVPQEVRYHAGYRYAASGSASHRKHFEADARRFLTRELTGPDPFIVEIGCNDGVMLETVARAGVRHLGIDPAKDAAEVAAAKGINVLVDFFDAGTAHDIRAEHGQADVIFGANTICHIAHIESVLRGVQTLLAPGGVFVFEEPYLDTVINKMAFDQIYDEHAFYFTVRSVTAMAASSGFELVDAEHVPLHGGEVRCTLARPGKRPVASAVAELTALEESRGLADMATFEHFAKAVNRVRDDLVGLLTSIRADARTVAGYGAPAKATTVTNYCGIGTGLLPFICDSTLAKQGRLVPGSHIPVVPPAEFSSSYPDFALLFAWNHAEEIMAKEHEFSARGGKWILYVPEVRIL